MVVAMKETSAEYKDPALDLINRLRGLGPGEAVTEKLQVDERVLARVTDGIYREPSSALRELISNAYDADATRVIIQTDAPRFDRIVISDDGNGMSLETLADLVCHIGGSSKRTAKGKRLGTAREDNAAISPGGRRLIGKIGIGLFAVSQLTQHFQIITKRKGDKYRTSAVVSLKTYTEEKLLDAEDEGIHFEPGDVTITVEPAQDENAHGTEIVLMNIRKYTKDILCSLDRWRALDEQAAEEGKDTLISETVRPMYHIGKVKDDDRNIFIDQPNLPWPQDASAKEKFNCLYQAVEGAAGKVVGNPTIKSLLDNYLAMLWDISLAAPVKYIQQHPFHTTSDLGIATFELSNEKRGQVESLYLADGETIADKLGLLSCDEDPVGGFRVVIDDIDLLHPIKLDPHIRGNIGYKTPMLFVGKCVSPFFKVQADLGGGALEFEAYFYWNQLIVPKENNGVLIRVNGASGTLFDETFMDYRVSELTRLKQLMAEIYVTKGLDPALNIDRESFNTSHPHYQYLKDWVHKALRQLTNKLKGINKSILDERKLIKSEAQIDRLSEHVDRVWRRVHGASAIPVEILLQEASPGGLFKVDEDRKLGGIVVQDIPLKSVGSTVLSAAKIGEHQAKIRSLVAVLSAYGLVDDMTHERLQSLVRDIVAVFSEEIGE